MEWIKGSHNTMSYLKPKQWWLRPFAIWGRCQDKTIEEALESGIRYFDLRVKFDSSKTALFGHGLITYEYEKSVEEVISWLIEKSVSVGKIYIRILAEKEWQEKIFKEWLEKNEFAKRFNEASIDYWFGLKNPWTVLEYNFDKEFVEISKQYNVKWHFILPPCKWLAEQDRIRCVVRDCKFNGIVTEDFV